MSLVMLCVSYIFAHDKETLANPYTAYHVEMVRYFLGAYASFFLFSLFRDCMFRLGKPRNKTLYIIFELFSIPLRLVVLYIYVVYGFWNLVPKALRLCWYSTYANWWKKKDEPFLTNASLVNALLAWWIYIAFWLFFVFFSFYFIALTAILVLEKGRDLWRRQLCPGIYWFLVEWIPMALRRYIWGLSEW